MIPVASPVAITRNIRNQNSLRQMIRRFAHAGILAADAGGREWGAGPRPTS